MQQFPLNTSTFVQANPEVIIGQIGDEVVMMNIERGNYYGLNPMASHIWHLLNKETSIAAICTQLSVDYDVARDVCESEVCDFISQLINEGLVLTKDGVG